jgi:hypothetical protein
MKFAAYMAFSFITFFHTCILLVPFFIVVHVVVCFVCFCNFCKLCIFTVMFMYSYCNVYVFLLLYMIYSVYSVSLCRSVHCFTRKCVMYYRHWLSTQLQSTNISVSNKVTMLASRYPFCHTIPTSPLLVLPTSNNDYLAEGRRQKFTEWAEQMLTCQCKPLQRRLWVLNKNPYSSGKAVPGGSNLEWVASCFFKGFDY